MRKIKFQLFIIIICLFLSIGSIQLLHSQSVTPPNTDNFFAQAEAYVQAGDTVRAMDALEKAIRQNHRDNDAYHRLAELHLGLGELENRIQARRALKEALYYDPDNVEYLNTRLKLYLMIDYVGAARNTIYRIIELNPDDPEPYFVLGTLYEKEWLKYYDMIKTLKEMDVPLSIWADGDLEKCIRQFEKAVEVDPDYGEAYCRMALLSYEEKDYDKTLSLLSKACIVKPQNSDYHLYMGMVHHRMGSTDDALGCFQSANDLMDVEELEVYNSIDMILHPAALDSFQQSSEDEKRQFIQTFWKQRDPLFLSDSNERILEHYSRIAYANLRFSVRAIKGVRKGIRGWKTDRGKVFVRFGPPEEKYKTAPIPAGMGGGSPGSPGGLPFRPSNSFWKYSDFEIVFSDDFLNGNYGFHWGVEEVDYKHFFNRIIDEVPERYAFISNENVWPLFCSIARYYNEKNENVLDVYQNVTGKEDEDISTFVRGVFLFDMDWNEIDRIVDKPPKLAPWQNSLLTGWNRLSVQPDEYNLVVEFQDPETGKLGRWGREIELKPFDRDSLQMSDVVTAWQIDDETMAEAVYRGGQFIIPNTLKKYAVSALIPIYFEIYNLTYSPEGVTHYRVSFILKKKEETRWTERMIRLLASKDSDVTVVNSSYEQAGRSRTERLHFDLVLDEATAGEYDLIVRITDLHTNESKHKMVRVMLSDPSK